MNKKSSLVMRIVAGMYLVYLGVKLIQGALSDRPSNMVFIMVMAVLFTVAGTGFVIFSAKSMIQMNKEENVQVETIAETEASEELEGDTKIEEAASEEPETEKEEEKDFEEI